MAELVRCPHGIDTGADEVTCEGVAEVVKPELRKSLRIQASVLRGVVESALRHVVPIERRPVGGRENVGVMSRKACGALDLSQVVA